MPARLSAIIVLAAGAGVRMRSPALPKALHGFAGRTLLGHVLAATSPLRPEHTLVVVGHQRAQVEQHLAELATTAPAEAAHNAVAVTQEEQRGTGHAVRLALDALPPGEGVVLVVPGDAPLLTSSTLQKLLETHESRGATATLLTSVVDDPTGYGRVLRRAGDTDSSGDGAGDGAVERVVEHNDASVAELAVHEVATSVYAFDQLRLRAAISRVGSDNAQGEEYLPDVVAILAGDGGRIAALVAPAAETAGVNDRAQLAAAHRAYNERLLTAHMRAGVRVVDPASTWVDVEVTLEPDSVLLPGVDLHGTTHVCAGATIGPHTTLTDTVVGAASVVQRAVATEAVIGAGVSVGPFAYLRPGTALGDDSHVGAYVELKKARVGTASKVPHLSYVGDAVIGEHSNIGAATVFVNYDGVDKHSTIVGDHVRIGSDTMIIAPREIGDGAYTAAGSVITADVPPGAMAVARGRQRNVQGWVARRRAGTPAAEAAARAHDRNSPDGAGGADLGDGVDHGTMHDSTHGSTDEVQPEA